MKMFREFNFNVYNFIKYKTIVLKITLITVRNKYKLSTGTLDDNFVKNLQFKSGAEEQEIRGIVYFIKYLDDAPEIGHEQLSDFHKQLESFYKKA